MEDPRFRHIASDPRFKGVPRKRRKVTVDSRFKSMFTDDRFKVNYNIDKRGSKVIQQSSSEDLKKYYDINSSEDENGTVEEEEGEEEEDEEDDNLERVDSKDEQIDKTSDEEIVTEDKDALYGMHSDQENDGGSVEVDSDSKEEEVDSEEEEEVDSEEEEGDSDSSTDIEDEESLKALTANGVFSDWLDQVDNTEKSEETGYRLALCNMNWDRITAIDLYALFNSFRPPGGVVKSVFIYLSDFGRERLKEEELQGPQELLKDTPSDDEETPTNSKDSKIPAGDKLREYQLKRLQYYYAVIECDSHSTAEHVYKECDGLEFELSSSCVDLRFISDDMSFDEHKPTSVATESSLTKDYQPPEFMTTALQQSNVHLTWDETHPSRLNTTMKNYNKNNISEANFDGLLGSSSEEDEAESNNNGAGSVEKYRSLLGLSSHGKEEVEKGEEELEITWNIGLNEENGQKFKSRKKTKKDVENENDNEEIKETEKEDKGFDDPFFTQPSSRKRKRKLTREEDERIQKEKDDLELLVLSDTEDTKEHFSLAGIMKQEKKESAKKKRRERKDKKGTKESSTGVSDFTLDLNDPRFSALYTSHHYAIEPSNHQYKPTKGMKSLLQERQKRRKEKAEIDVQTEDNSTISSPSLQMLVKSVKAKAHKSSSKKLQKRSLH